MSMKAVFNFRFLLLVGIGLGSQQARSELFNSPNTTYAEAVVANAANSTYTPYSIGKDAIFPDGRITTHRGVKATGSVQASDESFQLLDAGSSSASSSYPPSVTEYGCYLTLHFFHANGAEGGFGERNIEPGVDCSAYSPDEDEFEPAADAGIVQVSGKTCVVLLSSGSTVNNALPSISVYPTGSKIQINSDCSVGTTTSYTITRS